MMLTEHSRLSVAPMMEWTDRHCRYFHRQLSSRVLLYTEMVTAPALLRGDAAALLRHDPVERPVALQLGGSDPVELASAAGLADGAGFAEVNLNVGCPSDRVRSGCFGAVLMKEPARVAECVAAMREATRAEITVKCRIGVDEQEPRETLPAFLETLRATGLRRVIVHARKAWLNGLSPKQNRTVPPLDHALVAEMVRAFPDLRICLNGGIATLEDAARHLDAGFAGVMIGRAAYQSPAQILAGADARLWSDPAPEADPVAVAHRMIPYIEAHVAEGGRAHSVTRHMLGLFAGQPGARHWRRHLSEAAACPKADARIVPEALAAMQAASAAARAAA